VEATVERQPDETSVATERSDRSRRWVVGIAHGEDGDLHWTVAIVAGARRRPRSCPVHSVPWVTDPIVTDLILADGRVLVLERTSQGAALSVVTNWVTGATGR
jgi:hypothetical protein